MQTPEENRSAPQLKRQTPAQKAAGATTRFLHVAGIDPDALQANENYDALKGLFERFGALEESHGMTVCAEKVSGPYHISLLTPLTLCCMTEVLLGPIPGRILCGRGHPGPEQ